MVNGGGEIAGARARGWMLHPRRRLAPSVHPRACKRRLMHEDARPAKSGGTGAVPARFHREGPREAGELPHGRVIREKRARCGTTAKRTLGRSAGPCHENLRQGCRPQTANGLLQSASIAPTPRSNPVAIGGRGGALPGSALAGFEVRKGDGSV